MTKPTKFQIENLPANGFELAVEVGVVEAWGAGVGSALGVGSGFGSYKILVKSWVKFSHLALVFNHQMYRMSVFDCMSTEFIFILQNFSTKNKNQLVCFLIHDIYHVILSLWKKYSKSRNIAILWEFIGYCLAELTDWCVLPDWDVELPRRHFNFQTDHNKKLLFRSQTHSLNGKTSRNWFKYLGKLKICLPVIQIFKSFHTLIKKGSALE